MKKILIPTDFSAIANNATAYAINLAAAFKSKLFLYHVYSMKRGDYDLQYSDKEQPFRKKVAKKMKQTKDTFEELLSKKGLNLKTKAYQGYLKSLFGRTVKKDGIGLIVMGSKGATGITKVIFGSTAAKALDTATIPLLVVPPDHSFDSIRHIVLAIDHEEVSPEVLSPLQELAATFKAQVSVLTIKTDQHDAKRETLVDLEGLDTTYREIPLSNNINESIREFIEQEDCDLLCMVRRKKGFFESMFKKSITKAQVFDNRIPLLILPE